MSKVDTLKESNEFRVSDPSKPVKIFRRKSDKVEPITVPALMKRTVENFGKQAALMYKDEITKEWIPVTYNEYREKAEKMAKVFIKLGLKRHGTVAVLAFNCVEWFVSELATIHAGGVIAGVYTTNSVDSCFHVLDSSQANIVVVDDPKQMEKIRAIKDKLPHLKAVIQMTPPYAQYIRSDDGYWRWNELEQLDTSDVEEEYQRRLADIAPNECCGLVYTSGTLGNPKGVMMSHDNFIWDSYNAIVHFDNLQMGKEVLISYLPLSHVAAQIMDIFIAMTLGATVYFADKDAMKGSLIQTMRDVRPTHFMGVPRIYEKFHEKMSQASLQVGTLKRILSSWARHVTLEHHLNRMAGRPSNSIQYKLAQKLMLSKYKQALGLDRAKNLITGAAPLCVETKKFFLSIDLPIIEAFGMSETTGAHCISNIDQPAFETIGKHFPEAQTKISFPDDKGHGEICVKGRHVFMGYLHQMEKTLETFDDDGWLHTGDVGYVDKDGYIYITGRIKELIITAGGENIPPVLIENNVKAECSAISNALLVGDRMKFLTILITLKTEANNEGAPIDELSPESRDWLEGIGLRYKKLSEILAAGPDQRVLESIQEAINRANKKAISNAQKIQKFAILPQDFSVATGELGPTMKLKRSVVVEKYNNIIEKFYN